MATRNLVSSISRRLTSTSPKLNQKPASPKFSPLNSTSTRRIPITSRLPVELGSVETNKPLHSVIASARLTSSLSIINGWCLVPQGVSMPL